MLALGRGRAGCKGSPAPAGSSLLAILSRRLATSPIRSSEKATLSWGGTPLMSLGVHLVLVCDVFTKRWITRVTGGPVILKRPITWSTIVAVRMSICATLNLSAVVDLIILDNPNASRLSALTEKDMRRMNRYLAALQELRDAEALHACTLNHCRPARTSKRSSASNPSCLSWIALSSVARVSTIRHILYRPCPVTSRIRPFSSIQSMLR